MTHRNYLYLTPQSWHRDDDAENSDDGQIFVHKINCDREYEISHYIYYQLIALVQLVGNNIILYIYCMKNIYQVFKNKIPNSENTNLMTQSELQDLLQDLNVSKNQAEHLSSTLHR